MVGGMQSALQHANRIAKKMENTEIEAESNGLVIVFNGKMEVQKVFFEDTKIIGNEIEITKAIETCLLKATKHIQALAAEAYGKAISDFKK